LVRAIADQSETDNATPPRDGFIGTPHFASPEQFAGQPTDARSDIFSLGVTLWFMLTATLPFDGNREKIQHQQLSGALPLYQLKGIPRIVVELIKRILEPDPAKRAQSPAALKEQLNKCIATLDRAKDTLRRRFTYGALAAVIVTGLVTVFYMLPRKSIPTPAPEIAPAKSIAVLPFENLSYDKEHTYLADGVQDDILTKLAQVADLKVISRTSVMQYRGKHDSREIGRVLGVSHVLEGTVSPANGKVHVNARLVDTRSDTDVWAHEYSRDLDEVFAIEAELTQSIASQLGARVSAREMQAIQEELTQDLVAYELYTRARNLDLAATFADKIRENYLLEASNLLDEAVKRDPSFFQAYCALARVQDRIYFRGYDHTPARLAMADAAVQAASRLRPEAGETHLARAANLYHGYLDYGGALSELQLARQSLPNDARVFQLLGAVQRRQGRWQESTQSLERAVELNPHDIETMRQIATINYGLFGRQAEEAALLDRALTIEPDHVETKFVRALVDVDWKSDTKPLHRIIDDIRGRDPATLGKFASEWVFCAMAERDAGAATAGLIGEGYNPFCDDIVTTRAFVEGLIARMTKDDEKGRVAFTTARMEQEKVVHAQPSFGAAWCVLGLIDAALGR
jgi:TolB-like protein/Tfp pilus assembly protein PilF